MKIDENTLLIFGLGYVVGRAMSGNSILTPGVKPKPSPVTFTQGQLVNPFKAPGGQRPPVVMTSRAPIRQSGTFTKPIILSKSR